MRRVVELAAVTGLSLVSLVLGCGGGGGGPSGFGVGGPSKCGQVLPCAGDLTGSWAFDTGCITAAGITEATAGTTCPGETLGVTDVKVSGTATFNADMTYTLDALSQQATFVLTVPSGCVGGVGCPMVAVSILATGQFDSVNCTGTSTCTCTVVQTPVVANETGTYTVAGNTLTTTSDTGNVTSVDTCVQTPYLHMVLTQAMSMGAMGQATIIEDTVGTKQ